MGSLNVHRPVVEKLYGNGPKLAATVYRKKTKWERLIAPLPKVFFEKNYDFDPA
jgi:hypothetical protein